MMDTDEPDVVARRLAKLCKDFAYGKENGLFELEKAGVKLEDYSG